MYRNSGLFGRMNFVLEWSANLSAYCQTQNTMYLKHVPHLYFE